MKQPLIILKIILLFSIIILLKTNFYKSKYTNETEIKGIVISITEKETYSKIELKAKEKIIVYTKEPIKYNIGDKVLLTGTLKKPEQNKIFNTFNYQKYLKSQKIYWIFEADKIKLIKENSNIIYKVKNTILKRTQNLKSKAYINNFLLGINEHDSETKETYSKTGTSHLMALSGTHTALIVLLSPNTLVAIIIMLIYLLLTSFPISLTRACLFFLIIKIKNTNKKEILQMMALLFLVINSYLIYNLSFIFSFTITYFIINIESSNKKIKNAFNLSLTAYLAGLPIQINNFFETNLLTPLINMIFVPIFTIIIFPLSVITLSL